MYKKLQSNITLLPDHNFQLKWEWTTINASRTSLTVPCSHFLFVSNVSDWLSTCWSAGDWLEMQFLDSIKMQVINTELLSYLSTRWLFFFFNPVTNQVLCHFFWPENISCSTSPSTSRTKTPTTLRSKKDFHWFQWPLNQELTWKICYKYARKQYTVTFLIEMGRNIGLICAP